MGKVVSSVTPIINRYFDFFSFDPIPLRKGILEAIDRWRPPVSGRKLIEQRDVKTLL